MPRYSKTPAMRGRKGRVMTANRLWVTVVAVIVLNVLWGLHVVERFLADAPQQNNLLISSSRSPPVIISSQPHNHDFSFSVAICALTRDYEAYITEWIDYHLMGLEFDQIILYDNSDTFEMKRWYDNTRNSSIYSKVEVNHFPGRGYLEEYDNFVQNAAYEDCMERYGRNGPKHDYVAFFDTDEFLVLQQTDKYSIIHQVIRDYLLPYGGGLSMNWILFGTANRTVYSPVPTLKRFQYRDPTPHRVIKTIVKTSDFESVRNPHAVFVVENKTIHNTAYPGSVQPGQDTDTGASDPDTPLNVILVYHYRFLSVKEYTYKRCIRGEAIGGTKGCSEEGLMLTDDAPDHALHRPGTVLDTLAWDFLTLKVPKYKIFEKEEWADFH